uniref:Uncharacterized protein n=1 Tax=Aliivibrio wodanis TaxID=80852 RepID=A0A5Q4ZVC0_9GAMM|nr:hypothetical protein AW0309160_03544 [Aliivibrio wodanis]VVV06074.1 hypothetical protein AW0309160_03558 [Aliivibrio wodanis]VVV06088.1 hypothetical protein AW0309160_03572 [Aliivibrio wodanis]
MEHVVKIVDSVAWPVLILILSVMFKRSLGVLTERVSKFKYKDVEANFGQELQKIEGKAKNLPKHPVTSIHHDKEYWDNMTIRGVFTQWDQIKRIADTSPKAAILEAWLDVDIAVFAAARAGNIDTSKFCTAVSQARELMDNGNVPRDIWPIITDLHRLKRQVEKSNDFSTSYDETTTFIDLSLKTGNEFREFAMAIHLNKLNAQT